METAPLILMTKKCFTEFCWDRRSNSYFFFFGAKCFGLPVEVSTPETVKKLGDMMLAYRGLKVREIIEAIDLSHGSVV